MSATINQAHVMQYKADIILLSQQRGSRLRKTVREDGNIIGKRVYFDRLGVAAAQKVTTRHGDTPLMNTPHSRRAANMVDYDWADLLDKADSTKILTNPTGKYTISGSNALGRAQDDEIITALGGSAMEGEEGGSTVALPSAQKVAHATTNLTLAKLLTANRMLDEAEVDEMYKRYIACSAKQIEGLLGDTSLTSTDFNTVRTLVNGKIDSFMGFTFVRTERLGTDANGDRKVYAYAETAVGLGVPQDITVDVGPRRDKRNATQVYLCQSLGAVRIEDVQVVEIACRES